MMMIVMMFIVTLMIVCDTDDCRTNDCGDDDCRTDECGTDDCGTDVIINYCTRTVRHSESFTHHLPHYLNHLKSSSDEHRAPIVNEKHNY